MRMINLQMLLGTLLLGLTVGAAAEGYRLIPIVHDGDGQTTEIRDLNNRGEIVGVQYRQGEESAFRWRNGQLTLLNDVLLGERNGWSAAIAVNDWSTIAAVRGVDLQREAVLLRGNRTQIIELDGERRIEPEAMNNWGQVVARRLDDSEAGSFC